MTVPHPNVQHVIQAMRQTTKANGATVDVSEDQIHEMLKKVKLEKRIANLPKIVLKVVLASINGSGYGSIRDGMLPATPQWISDAKIVVSGCGPRALRKRVQRVTSAMNNGIAGLGARPVSDPSYVWRWLKPLEPFLAKMFNPEFENLIRYHNSGCGLVSAKHRVQYLPNDIRINTNGRVVVPPGLPPP